MGRLALACGGTGGHIFPAQALANRVDNAILIGVFDKKALQLPDNNKIFNLPGSSKRSLKSLFLLFKAIIQSIRILKREKIEGVIGYGSYASLAPLIAAKWLNIPFWLCELDLVPSLVNQYLSPYAQTTFLHFFPTKGIKGKTVFVQPFLDIKQKAKSLSQKEARISLGLKEDVMTIFVFGGSLGALTLNNLFMQSLEGLQKNLPPFQVIHLIGDREDRVLLEKQYKEKKIDCYVRPFCQEISVCYLASDMGLTRAGSSTLRELILHNLPSICIPHPSVASHQKEQALYFSNELCASLFLAPSASSQDLMDCFCRLMHNSAKIKKRLAELFERETTKPDLLDFV